MNVSRGFRLGLVTSHDEPSLTADDQILLPHLQKFGIAPSPVIWNDPGARPAAFDALVLRSAWDYHLHLDPFLAWVGAVEHSGVPLWNDGGTIRWNSDKSYLLDLERRGIRIPETIVVRHPHDSLPATFDDGPVVLKPSISAGAFRTRVIHHHDEAQFRTALDEILSHSSAVIQEYMPEIALEGELSFMFVDGSFCHAVRKSARQGDFRVQEEHGGTTVPFDPPRSLISQAQECLEVLDPTPLYARVDAVRRGDLLYLMELELIEPSL
jgi:glutathione synthase/RimK-type ligase-like ATP-grasp enzyme